MIYLKCQCGSGLGVPGSFLGESIACDDCGRKLRLVAGHEVSDGRAVQWQLRVDAGPPDVSNKGELFLLGGESPVEVGKADGRHLLLAGMLVSRAHCRLVPLPNGWMVEDVGSRNGTFVNGTRVTSQSLREGDLIDIGEWTLVYGPVGPPAPKPALKPIQSSAMPTGSTRRVAAATPPPLPAFAYDEASPQSGQQELMVEITDEEAEDSLGAEYDLAEPAPVSPAVRQRPAATAYVGMPAGYGMAQPAPASLAAGPKCPCCRKTLGFGARICVECGIDIKTGRPLLTAHGLDDDALHIRAENSIRVLSWFVPFGLFPIASEARGNAKPYAIWSIAGITALCSLMFFVMMATAPAGEQPRGADLMLWAGDPAAADQQSERLREELERIKTQDPQITAEELQELEGLAQQPPPLKFQPHQLLTHALLHGGLMHIAGNFIFLFVLGMRVNALLGNLKTAIIYPILAIGGGLGHVIAMRGQPASPMIGASGAIMGLAGMYLILFPAYRVHMVIWLRLGLFTGFRLLWKIWAVRGFWVVLFYIAFDILATVFGSKDGVAHWAHLGGFLTGIAIALILLFSRMVNAYGGDLLSVMLGRHAWALLGRPGERDRVKARAPAVNPGAAA